jgi:hypothetical protein
MVCQHKSMNAPALYNLDLSVAKRLQLGEARELQLRAEFFNSLNHPEFGWPNATAGVAGAGTIATTQRANRQIQFALRLQFDRRCPNPDVHGCGARVQQLRALRSDTPLVPHRSYRWQFRPESDEVLAPGTV